MKTIKIMTHLTVSTLLALGLTACGGGGSSTETSNGSLAINNGTDIRIGEGVVYTVPVSLDASTGVNAVAVTISSSDNSIVTIYPKTCYLSSTQGHNSCLVFVRGKNNGSVVLTASATGYSGAHSKVSVRANTMFTSSDTSHYTSVAPSATAPNYGQLQIGSFPSANPPSTSNFAMTAQVGDTITLATSITGFDTPLNGVPVLLSVTSGGASIVGNAQCNVDSNHDANHYCLYKVKIPATPTTVVVTASAVGNTASDFSNSPTTTITVQSAAVPGQIVLQGMGSGIPVGMSSPFWLVLQDSSGVNTPVTVGLTSRGGLSINPGISGTSQTQCTLSSASPVCGFGALGTAATVPDVMGDMITATTAASSGYTIFPLWVRVVQPSSTSRTIKFQNNDANTVWVGITGGTATSFLTNQMVSTLNPQTSGANVTCGPSNPAAACPTGSTCHQGGANPGSDTIYYCYWDQLAPSNGYAIASASQAMTAINISDSSYDPVSDITWSGNFYPRQGCTTNSGVFQCAIADCGSGTSSQACAPGTGGSPGIATLSEVTLQANSTDYYDISIIGGANVAANFGPDSASSPPIANGYSCGTAGSTSAQGTLSASDWSMATHIQGNPTTGTTTPFSTSSQTGTATSTAYYHYTQSPSAGRVGAGCALQTDPNSYCETPSKAVPGAASNYVCGYDQVAVNNGSTSDYTTSCGTHLAWLSANAIFALNTAASNAAPFPFATTYTTSAAGAVSLSSLYLCNNSTNKSGYASNPTPDASTACGCTNWGDGGLGVLSGDVTFSSQLAAPTQTCSTNNAANGTYYWTQNILPTITWLKQSCPTCYTYPFDDMSSTFQCDNPAASSGLNSVAYLIQFNGTIAGQ
jgi:hypothetical protein